MTRATTSTTRSAALWTKAIARSLEQAEAGRMRPALETSLGDTHAAEDAQRRLTRSRLIVK
jgi:hypothetical protein